MNSFRHLTSTLARAVPTTAALLVASLSAFSAHAQAANGLGKEKTVSSGATEVTTEGFVAAATASAENKDATTFKIMAGGLWTAGNSRSLSITGASDFLLRRQESEFRARAALNYGQAAADRDADQKKTVNNYQGNVRYNYFFNDALSGFLSVSGRKDEFQFLVLRLNIDPGLAYYFLDEKNLQVWSEVGYDLQYDIREDDKVDETRLDPDVEDLDKTETRHGARVLLGYIHQLSPDDGLDSWVEYIHALNDTKFYRINGSAAITSQLAGSLSLASSVTVRYDANPVDDEVEKTDLVMAVNLVYTLQ